MRTIEQAEPQATPDVPAGFLLARLGEAASGLYRESFKGTGLKPPHVAALSALRLEPISQQALSEATNIDPVKLVGVLNDLETAGLVERRRDIIDRRRHIVALTCPGRERLAAVERAAHSVEERIFAGLAPVQRAQLVTLLELVMETSRLGLACNEAESRDGCPGDGEPDA